MSVGWNTLAFIQLGDPFSESCCFILTDLFFLPYKQQKKTGLREHLEREVTSFASEGDVPKPRVWKQASVPTLCCCCCILAVFPFSMGTTVLGPWSPVLHGGFWARVWVPEASCLHPEPCGVAVVRGSLLGAARGAAAVKPCLRSVSLVNAHERRHVGKWSAGEAGWPSAGGYHWEGSVERWWRRGSCALMQRG